MKPVSIRFKCFGPYMDEQFIDFAQLEKNGLFLICGETGSGKTTILDAMCYALYGKSSGGIRGDLTAMRCKLADKSDETLVEFVFDCGGQRYKFVRSLKYARKNLNDSHNCMVLRDGEYVPILENPKATAVVREAERIIGLTYDQFRQVIILPQGQFEKLLVSDSAEKEKILVSLFHAQQWQDIADEISRRVTARDQALKLELSAMTAKLRDYGVTGTEALEQKRAEDAEALGQLQARQAEGEQALGLAKGAYEQGLLENRDFEELARRQTALQQLLPREGQFRQLEQRLGRADLAEGIRPQYDAYRTAGGAAQGALQRVEEAQRKLDKAQLTEHTALTARQTHEQGRPAYEQQKRELTLLEDARGLYETLAEKQQAAKQAQLRVKKAEDALGQATRELELSDGLWKRAMERQTKAMADYAQAQQLYLTGIGSALAQRLEPGLPCPVCGSTHHPDPAQPAPDHVSEAELETKNKAVQAAGKAVTDAHTQRSHAEEQRSSLQVDLMSVQQIAAAAKTEYDTALGRKISGVEDLRQLNARVMALTTGIRSFERAEDATARSLTEAQGSRKAAHELLTSAEQVLEEARETLRQQRQLWQQALTEGGFAGEEDYLAVVMEPRDKQRQQKELLEFKTALHSARQALAQQETLLEGRAAPDVEALQETYRLLERQQKVLHGQCSVAASRLETLERDVRDLTARREKYDKQRQAVDADLEFAKRLQGRTGVSLQRYVLGVMLTSITAAANRLLKSVHGGRYQLYRTDAVAGSGHKSGLELEVWDARNNERRSVTTLSGGEKFLVALSLAIGLSTVVQAQGSGIRLEAMFIDEGFGSLDSSSINDALEVLQGIRRSHGVVGIISHVDQLAETIPTKIRIIKGSQGSRCEVEL